MLRQPRHVSLMGVGSSYRFVEGRDGFFHFLRAIPFNYYALLTILTMVLLVVLKVDYGSMRVHEDNALRGDIYTTIGQTQKRRCIGDDVLRKKGGAIDLVISNSCTDRLLYYRKCFTVEDFFSGVSFVEAFSASDASVGLMFGSFLRICVSRLFFYALKEYLTDSMACIPVIRLVPAIHF